MPREMGSTALLSPLEKDLSLDSPMPVHSHYHLTVSTEAWSVSRKILIPCSGRCLDNVKSGWIVKVSDKGKNVGLAKRVHSGFSYLMGKSE